MSSAADVADQVQEAAVADRTAEIVDLLDQAATIARGMGRTDWSRKMEQLIRHISGHRSSPISHLRQVGPMVSIDQWEADVAQALVDFTREIRQAHSEDPDGFPLERTAADWYGEFSGRLR